jgi:hypothetical protein
MAATWWVQKDEVGQSLGVVLPKRNQVHPGLASSILTTGALVRQGELNIFL